MSDDKIKDRFSISADELHHRMELQDEYHDKPLKSVTDFIADGIRRVLTTLGVDVTQSDEMVKLQQEELNIIIAERPPEEMGKLSGFYVIAAGAPIAIIGDAYVGSNGLAYIDIFWIQKNYMEQFGGVRIIH